MDPLAAILNAPGGWIAFTGGMAVVGALFLRGDIVARFVYQREQERADKLAGQLDRNTEALRALTDRNSDSLRSLAEEVRWSRPNGHDPSARS